MRMWTFSDETHRPLQNFIYIEFPKLEKKGVSHKQIQWKNLLNNLTSCRKVDKIPSHTNLYSLENIEEEVQIQCNNTCGATIASCPLPYIDTKLSNSHNDEDNDTNYSTTKPRNIIANNDDQLKIKYHGFVDRVKNGNALSTEDLHEVFKIAMRSDIDVAIIMEHVNNAHSVYEILKLWDICISVEPNNVLIENFFKYILRPRLQSLEPCRPLELYLQTILRNFKEQLVHLVILPIILNFEENFNSFLLLLINSLCDEYKHVMLGAFLDNGMLCVNRIPILSKLVTREIDDLLILKLIKFIHKYKEEFADELSFGRFLIYIIKLLSSKITKEEKDLLIETMQCNPVTYKTAKNLLSSCRIVKP